MVLHSQCPTLSLSQQTTTVCIGVHFKTLVAHQWEEKLTYEHFVSTCTVVIFGMHSHYYFPTEPAKVDITTVLPLSTWSVVGGAGRSDIRVNIGGNVTLYCPTTGIDTPNTRWLLNGTTMVSNLPRVVITNETVNNIPAVVLTINNITTSDLVTYTCVTSNSDGTDTQNITIRGEIHM